MLLWVLSSVMVRGLHDVLNTPLWSWEIWHSGAVQLSLTLLWTLLACIGMTIASTVGQFLVMTRSLKAAGGNAGYDAAKGIMVDDMIKAGIIDPVKVERAGVQHAVSAAGILLTSECAIADEPEPEKAAMPDMSGMGGMY
jgi:chaperonin GroEL